MCHRSLGLVQNQIEGAGISTLSMTVQPHITGSAGTPRAVFLRYPAGNQVGEAGKPQQQRAILTAALEAVAFMESPGAILELPYRWRRFPIVEEAVYSGTSEGVRHPQAEAVGEALDTLVRLANDYKVYMEERVAKQAASPVEIPGGVKALQDHALRIKGLIEILDAQALDQLREIVNRITTTELRVSGNFV